MRRLHVSQPEILNTPRGQRLSAQFCVGLRRKKVWFHATPGPMSGVLDPFVPVALIPAMQRGWRLCMDGAVSERLLQETEPVQKTLIGWYPKLSRVEILCVPVSSPVVERRGAVGLFFSGGVDSFYSLRRHRAEITDLIFVHGVDMALWQLRERKRAAESVRAIAEKEGLRFVEVETNLRQFGEYYVHWVHLYFGAALGAVALLLAPRFDRIYIPASVGADELEPMGSHPDLDTYWTNGIAEVVHDGLEATRFDKVREIADWPLFHSHLRVCYQNRTENMNCGRCVKCLWTMMMLESMGRLKDIETFGTKLDLRRLRHHPPVHKYQRQRFTKALAVLAERDGDMELRNTLQEMLDAGGYTPIHVKAKRLMFRAGLHLSHLMPYGK